MTFTITKLRLAAAIAAVVLLIPATAVATHIFDDVPDSAFYAAAVEWAAANGVTTGTSPTTFEPDRGVTRGEALVFDKRILDNVVQPALDDRYTKSESDAAIAALDIPVVYWAWVNSPGALYTGTSSPGVSSTRPATGEYVVTFPVDVTGCSWSVAHRSVDGVILFLDPDFDDEPLFDLSTRVTGSVILPPVTPFPMDIRVHVTDEVGTDKNTNFDLQVIC